MQRRIVLAMPLPPASGRAWYPASPCCCTHLLSNWVRMAPLLIRVTRTKGISSGYYTGRQAGGPEERQQGVHSRLWEGRRHPAGCVTSCQTGARTGAAQKAQQATPAGSGA